MNHADEVYGTIILAWASLDPLTFAPCFAEPDPYFPIPEVGRESE